MQVALLFPVDHDPITTDREPLDVQPWMAYLRLIRKLVWDNHF